MAGDICHAAKIRTKDDLVRDRRGRMQCSSRSLGELCVEEKPNASWRQPTSQIARHAQYIGWHRALQSLQRIFPPIATLVLESSVITVGDGPRVCRTRPIPLISVSDTRILTQCQRLLSQAGGPLCSGTSKPRCRTISSFPG